MQKIALTLASLILAFAFTMLSAEQADAAIHEMVAAYCSGGGVGTIDSSGFLEPRGVTGGSNPTANNFAKPVISSGVVVGTFPNLTVGSTPAAKFQQGTNALTGLNSSTVNHPSAAHCQKVALPSP
jgi:hypothetical protein